MFTKNIKPGEFLREVNHYQVQSVDMDSNKVVLIREGNGKKTEVTVSLESIDDMTSCDQYDKTVMVTKEDSKSGNPGIRSIFSSIPKGEFFTVVFKEDDTKKSDKAIKKERLDKIDEISKKIEAIKKSKKGVAKSAMTEISNLINNPISETIPGQERTLRGYKDNMESNDGLYLVRDLDISDKTKNYRNVNIRTIKSLIYNGTKYEVKTK